MLTDPQDKVVPSQNQSEFVERFRAAGGGIEQLFVASTSETHHGLKSYSTLVIKHCVLNASHQEIRRNLETFVQQRLDKAEAN